MSKRVFVKFQRADGASTEPVWINPDHVWAVRPRHANDDPSMRDGVTRLDISGENTICVRGSVMQTMCLLSGS